MGRSRAIDNLRNLTPPPVDFWQDLCSRINTGQVIPIIGNTVIYEQIFDIDGDGLMDISQDNYGWGTEDQLAEAWAAGIGFPINGQHRLAQVALYNRVVRSSDDLSAKISYLNWLKSALLYLARDKAGVDPAMIGELKDELEQISFSNIAVELGYPHPVEGQPDALAQLAQLPLPIYITTSCFDFLERAILANGRTPRTQICFWSGDPSHYVDDSHCTDYTFVPTPETPLVYHLFGLEIYPESLVLTEDDYLDFLAIIVQDSPNQQRPRLPIYLRQALTQSSLVLLGYQLHAWDFRILFRGIIKPIPFALRMFNLAIQLNPENQQWAISPQNVKAYLKGYFDKEKQLNFTVKYNTTANFVNDLWEAWNRWR